jgi:hypothetical protein
VKHCNTLKDLCLSVCVYTYLFCLFHRLEFYWHRIQMYIRSCPMVIGLLVFNAIFNNMSVISQWTVVLHVGPCYQHETLISNPRNDISRGLMTRAIWKRSCINLFITYFARADNILLPFTRGQITYHCVWQNQGNSNNKKLNPFLHDL